MVIDWENSSGGGDMAMQGKDQPERRHHGSTQITVSTRLGPTTWGDVGVFVRS